MQKKKITKSMRKAIKGPNSMVEHCVKHGSKMIVDRTKYIGLNPVFADLNKKIIGAIPNFQKVQRGIPFVRV